MMAPRASSTPPAADLAIVGGGSVAVSLLYQFLLSLEPAGARPLAIVLFEPQAEPGAGDAYQDDLPSNLLNIPAGNMSARADHRLDFVEWLRVQDPAWLRAHDAETIAPTDFLPRPLFGAYMRAVYERARALARAQGIALTHVRSRVRRVAPLPGGGVHVNPNREPPASRAMWRYATATCPRRPFPGCEMRPDTSTAHIPCARWPAASPPMRRSAWSAPA
ncbi:FAD/NAD(P)-binding protein [Achromobacter insolitus]|uniref:FAD/NAD(P)-binding protein n=1 Tax=Achromobacter insolitus TaxID=217204 RepID=UPI0020C61DA5|nr:FAD/NAD(P)-binding protein [Achromobacter insolitus]MDQ6216244.1 FAD/NAD(P)-binding protein [Achromobacter insolitus]